MSTKSLKNQDKNKLKEIDQFFSKLFDDAAQDFELEAKIFVSKILADIKEITDAQNINRSKLASMVGTSASFLTQLYTGSKLLNFITLMKFRKALDLEIDVRVKNNPYNCNVNKGARYIVSPNERVNWTVHKNYAPQYDGKSSYSKDLKKFSA